MSSTIRTFVGLRAPCTPALQSILRDIGRLGHGLRLTSPADLHLTLKFLGETPASQLPAIHDALAHVAGEATLQTVELTSLGAFPDTARPAVLWAGLHPAEGLKQLAAALDRRLEPLGFVPEARPYHPHLTLARVKGPVAGLADLIAVHRETQFGELLLDRVELFQSEQTSTDRRYTVLSSAVIPGG